MDTALESIDVDGEDPFGSMDVINRAPLGVVVSNGKKNEAQAWHYQPMKENRILSPQPPHEEPNQ